MTTTTLGCLQGCTR